jgi:hypothetical protein
LAIRRPGRIASRITRRGSQATRDVLVERQRRFGWDRIFYRPVNVTPRPAGSAISEHVRRRIEGDNQYDLELYAYAQALFERAVAAQDPSFAIELEAFRRLNAANQRSKIDGAPARLASVTFASQAPRLLAEYASEQPDGANGRSYREFRAHLLEFCTAWDAPPQLGPWNDAASPQARPAVSA